MKPWDGTYNGKALPVDSYFYMIEYNDDYTTGSKGNVSIIIVQ
jgi:gliding motility-associated-like protein